MLFSATRLLLGVGVALAAARTGGAQAPPAIEWKFDFGARPAAPGYVQVLPAMRYSAERGFGFEPGASLESVDNGERDGERAELRGDGIASDQPFLFSIALPEGNYRVTVTLGDARRETNTTVKAELRRLMLENVRTAPGQFATRTFAVNVRTPRIATGGEVRLKDRERTSEWRAWDEKLTLEFNGTHPAVCALEIRRADDLPTVYLLGDSTVTDQPTEPWNSWGQMLTRFFKPEVVVANHAESGETLRSSLGARRLDKVLSAMKPGDYLLLQFGHNDMKERGEDIGAFTSYKTDLKRFVAEARRKGGRPMLVTSMERKSGVERDTLGDYPEAVRQVAREESVPLIDLHAMSKVLYRALGDRLGDAFQDGTHHNNYGSYELAKCVAQGIRQSGLPLARFLVDDFKGFDPAHPDAPADFHIPASPENSTTKPLGS